jgi:hypothetical protein
MRNKAKQPKKRRVRNWRPGFLAALAETPVLLDACAATKIHISTVMRAAKDEPAFRADFEHARMVGAFTLEREARRRAVEGTRKMKFFMGSPIMLPCSPDDPEAIHLGVAEDGSVRAQKFYIEHEYSDQLLALMLKRRLPEYRDAPLDPNRQASDRPPAENVAALLRYLFGDKPIIRAQEVREVEVIEG